MNGKSLEEILVEMLERMKVRRFSPLTIRQNRSGIGLFLRWLRERHGVQTPDRLRSVHIEGWQRHMAAETFRGRPLKPRAINKRLETLHNLLKYLADHGYASRHLARDLQYVKQPKVLPGSVLTHPQARRMLESVATDTPSGFRNRTMLELLYTSGIRAGELLGLDVEDVDFANATARVTGKGEKERVVPIGRTALGFLENYVKGVRPFLLRDPSEKALFLDDGGARLPYHKLLRIVHAAARAARVGVNITPHSFRRSCTTELLRGGAGMYHVKELLGHESLDTLQHYAKLTINDLRKEHHRCHPRERDGSGNK